MVSKKHFKSLFRGKGYKPSSFDNGHYQTFDILPLSNEGALVSLERMAGKVFAPYKDGFEQLLTVQANIGVVPSLADFEGSDNGWLPCMPTANVLILDIETLVQLDNYPIMAVALDPQGNIYYWCTPGYGQLITLPDNTLVIGHNVSFDAQGLANSYQGLGHGCLFMDTMAMAQACYGFCSSQFWANSPTAKVKPIWYYKGFGKSNYKSLKDTYQFLYPDAPYTDIDKSLRDIFVTATLPSEVFKNFEVLMEYNANDVIVTHKVLQRLYPYWLSKNPSPVTLVGSIVSSSYKLPIVPDWDNWISQVDQCHQATTDEVQALLLELADSWVVSGFDPNNFWHSKLDWTVKPKSRSYKGKPEWYRKELMAKGCITLRSRLAHYLLEMVFDGEPVYFYDGYRTQSTKIPHPDGDGNLGYLFSKDLLPLYDNGMLTSNNPHCKEILKKAISLTYWTSVRSRVGETQVRNNWALPQTGGGTVTGRVTDPLWLTTCDAKPHLIGSELKSRIRCSKGHKLLIADFSSQEMRIAWTLGDSVQGYMGSNPMSQSGIVGDKDLGTDAHSTLASKLSELTGHKFGRQDAKIIGFSMLYMAGVKAVASYIRQVMPELSIERAKEIAKGALEYRRGKTAYTDQGRQYMGGTDSDAYNAIDKVANMDKPRTPMLGREMSDPLCPKYVKSDFYTTRANWVVQGSARDQLDCLSVALTFMLKHANLQARLIWSRHDEVIVMAPEAEVKIVAELMQQAHCFTWAAFHESLNLLDMPEPGLLFDSIDVDTTVRKDPTKVVSTPSLSNDTDLPTGYSIKSTEFRGFSNWDEIHNISNRIDYGVDMG
jgi:DNA polymerase gamma 1